MGKRKLIATVRDPIDHFLSGWAECGAPFPRELQKTKHSPSYDLRVRDWLSYMQEDCKPGGVTLCSCKDHSRPQADFLINKSGKFIPNLGVIGDMHELEGLLSIAGLKYNSSVANGRDATANKRKVYHFPRDIGSLSNQTLQGICRYVALDYHLFDYDAPEACHEELASNWEKILSSSGAESAAI